MTHLKKKPYNEIIPNLYIKDWLDEKILFFFLCRVAYFHYGIFINSLFFLRLLNPHFSENEKVSVTKGSLKKKDSGSRRKGTCAFFLYKFFCMWFYFVLHLHTYNVGQGGEALSVVDGLFFFLTVIWVSEFLFFRGKSKQEPGDLKENKSFHSILACTVLSITSCVLLHQIGWTLFDLSILSSLGVVLYSLGIGLRYWSMFVLRGHFSRHVHVKATMELVSHGPYRLMRHPLYTGLFLCVLGISIYLGTIIGILLSVVIMTHVLKKRMVIEEKMLTATLPKQYEEWKQKRWILLPWVY